MGGHDMTTSMSSPIDIARPARNGSVSPRTHLTSNLTSALQSTSGNEARATPAMNISNGNTKGVSNGFGHQDSLTGGAPTVGSHWAGGAQPISMVNSNRKDSRRESIAGSLVGGMSWGGVSVGSWIRDDIIMQGTSPFAYQSPSFHSSSYLPKLEANFMRDFSCCGLTLPSLHELLQHYEDHHAQQMPTSIQKQNSGHINAPPDNKAAIAAGAAAAVQERAQQQRQQTESANTNQASAMPQRSATPATPRTTQLPLRSPAVDKAPAQLPPLHDMDEVQDMEMDDDASAPMSNIQSQYPMQEQPRMMQRSQFGQPPSARVPPLDLNTLNLGNPLQSHQGLRNSTPTTPVAAGRIGTLYQNNPTVSSVNTPTLTTHPLQQCANTPDSSTPGTPGEVNNEFIGNYGNISMGNNQYLMQNQYQGYGQYGYGNGNEMLDLCIDEPAKRLFSLDGGLNNPQQSSSSKMGDGAYAEDSEIAKTIREQQRMAGVPDPQLDGSNVPKPFHCPVIGCEKAYKNQNGLKYHKSHGHNTQQLAANENGTFSIVDPETLNPYPGTLGMEKHKPYRCEFCGKRYKNLNGLKYHKNHSPVCDNDQRRDPTVVMDAAAAANLNLNIDIPTPGMTTGRGEEMVM